MVRNSHLDLMDQDILYHLALGSGSHDLRAMFGDVKVKFEKIKFIVLWALRFYGNLLRIHPLAMYYTYNGSIVSLSLSDLIQFTKITLSVSVFNGIKIGLSIVLKRTL